MTDKSETPNTMPGQAERLARRAAACRRRRRRRQVGAAGALGVLLAIVLVLAFSGLADSDSDHVHRALDTVAGGGAARIRAVVSGGPLATAAVGGLAALWSPANVVGSQPGTPAAYEAAATMDPASAEIPAALAELYLRLNRTTDAIATAEKALKADPQAALVLETYDAYNYEYIVSIQKHLRFYGVENPIAVRALM